VIVLVLILGIRAHADAPTILVFDDSLSAGYGLRHIDQGMVGMLREKLKSEGYGYQVVTPASAAKPRGGLARLPRALRCITPARDSRIGANDGLRRCRSNRCAPSLRLVDKTVRRAAGLLLGIRFRPNYGPEYTEKFYQVA